MPHRSWIESAGCYSNGINVRFVEVSILSDRFFFVSELIQPLLLHWNDWRKMFIFIFVPFLQSKMLLMFWSMPTLLQCCNYHSDFVRKTAYLNIWAHLTLSDLLLGSYYYVLVSQSCFNIVTLQTNFNEAKRATKKTNRRKDTISIKTKCWYLEKLQNIAFLENILIGDFFRQAVFIMKFIFHNFIGVSNEPK